MICGTTIGGRSQELDQAYRRLRDEFSRIATMSSVEDSTPESNSHQEQKDASNAP